MKDGPFHLGGDFNFRYYPQLRERAEEYKKPYQNDLNVNPG